MDGTGETTKCDAALISFEKRTIDTGSKEILFSLKVKNYEIFLFSF